MGDQLFSVFYKNPTAVFGNGTETGLFPFHNVPEGSGAQTFAAHFSVPREPVILIAGENQFNHIGRKSAGTVPLSGEVPNNSAHH